MPIKVEVIRPLNHDLVYYPPGATAFLPKVLAESLAAVGTVKIADQEEETIVVENTKKVETTESEEGTTETKNRKKTKEIES